MVDEPPAHPASPASPGASPATPASPAAPASPEGPKVVTERAFREALDRVLARHDGLFRRLAEHDASRP
jgi:hypothetical protein